MRHWKLSALIFLLLPFLTDSVRAGEVLYNGIELPEVWPPVRGELTGEVMRVPYLENLPKVIPVDVGRQLFVDDFLIEKTDLERTFHLAKVVPSGINPVLGFEKPWEVEGRGPYACPFSDGVWYDPADKIFKMWYMGGDSKATCYATSEDGLKWTKPELDVEEGTNIVMRHARDSSTIWRDAYDPDPQRRYKMFTTVRKESWRLALHCSGDGIHWSQAMESSTPIGDRTTVSYNPFRKMWIYSIREQHSPRRRAYSEHADPAKGLTLIARDRVPWVGADKLDPRHPKFPEVTPELYNLDCVAYESLMLGLFSVYQGPQNRQCAELGIQKRNDILLGYSRDGFHFSRPDRRRFISCNQEEGQWDWGNIQSAGGCCLVVGDKLYFYYSARKLGGFWDSNAQTGLATLRRDGFVSMDAGAESGTLTTRPVTFRGKHLFVNADCPEGSLKVEVLNMQGDPIDPFSLENCQGVSCDKTLTPVTWKNGDLSKISGEQVRFRFHLREGRLYSFWVSPSKNGASHGYVAAGGPGFQGPTDTVGDGTVGEGSTR